MIFPLLPMAAALSRMSYPQGPVHPTPQRAPSPIALAPSGVDGLPLVQQSAVVAGAMAALGLGYPLRLALEAVGDAASPGPGGLKTTLAGILASLLGALFCLAGYTHFALPAAYEAIYPPLGTWGFWYLPGSASFHVAWTGAAEALGGAALLLGGLGDLFGDPLSEGRARPLRRLAASALFVLMIAVFPANIYQYTHGAIMVGAGPSDGPLPLEYHYVRLAVQIGLLSILSLLSKEEGKTKAGGDA